MFKTPLALLSRLRTDRDGVAAIEFALIAPIMLVFYFGMSEVSMAITKDRQVAHTASVIGDLAAQVETIDKEEAEDILTAALAVINVDNTKLSKVSVELNSYEMLDDGSNTINRIGHALMGSPISSGDGATFDPTKLSASMLNVDQGVIVARVDFRYQPVTYKFMNDIVLSQDFVLTPRKSKLVTFDGDGSSTDFVCTAKSDLTVQCN